MDQFAFGQRVFQSSADRRRSKPFVLFRQYPMLMVSLERMGIRSPATYNAVCSVRQLLVRAVRVGGSGCWRSFRAPWRLSRACAPPIRSLVRRPTHWSPRCQLCRSMTASHDGGIAFWMRSELAKTLPREGPWESRVIAAMAGRTNAATEPRIFWEGQSYRVDLAGAERLRLEVVRRKQAGHTLDLAFAIDDVARAARSPTLTVDGAQRAALAAKSIVEESASRLRHPPVNLLPPAVDPPRDGFEWLNDAATELSKINRPADLRRAPRIGASLERARRHRARRCAVVVRLCRRHRRSRWVGAPGGERCVRHDFGFGRKDSDTRTRMPWLQPRQDFQPGVPWHVAGSLLGLDVALAPMNLRRMSLDRIADAPKLSSVEREALADQRQPDPASAAEGCRSRCHRRSQLVAGAIV